MLKNDGHNWILIVLDLFGMAADTTHRGPNVAMHLDRRCQHPNGRDELSQSIGGAQDDELGLQLSRPHLCISIAANFQLTASHSSKADVLSPPVVRWPRIFSFATVF